ncbi:MAG TPA: SulP family inorganic anion transporter [Caulobacteraceae bacterium]|nr:SulP family inorganic anion transporter [Caulobacteraceae bacterium]
MTDTVRAARTAYMPKLATAFAEGYGLDTLRRDAMAGLTVAIVALPLSMAIAIASGVSPDRGLYAAIVGGFLVSALGGSRFQIGGPAGAFIVLVAATVARFGVDGLMLTVFLSGLMLTLVGVLRLGALIRLIPHAVTVGFTAGIAVTIAASQLKDFAGLTLSGPEPGPLAPKLAALVHALPGLSWPSALLAIGVVGVIVGLRRWRPALPGMLVAVAAAAAAAALLHLPVETVGSRFGGIPSGLPMPHLPAFTLAKVLAVLPAALSFTLLGGIESLLSAVVADGMGGGKHRSNMELVAQGIANVASSLFGGICVTGTIARTATNVRAGGRSPVAGMLHSVFLLAFMLLAAPAASYVPVSALAGVLAVVAWNMCEKAEVVRLMKHWRSAAVLLATFLLTILHDLTAGIAAGCVLAAFFWAVAKRARWGLQSPSE